MVIWTSAAQVMGKRKAGSQSASLTPDHKKSGIDLFPMSDLGVRHGVGKISTRATTLVKTSSRSDPAVGSYELPKSRDSNWDNFETISGLKLGSPKKMCHLDVVPVEWRRVRVVVNLVCQSARGLSQHPGVFPNVN